MKNITLTASHFAIFKRPNNTMQHSYESI